MGEFDSRRQKLFDSLPDHSVVLIYSGVSKIVSEDEFYPFFANRNFFYLTGIEQENSILMLIKCPGEKKEYLFLDEYNELKERWTGKRLSYDKARSISSIDNVYANTTFDSMLEMALAKTNNVYGRIDNLFIDLSDEIKIKTNYSTQVLAKDLGEKYSHLKVENVYPYIVELRLKKSAYEIAQLEEAINNTSTGINELLLNMKLGMSEHELSDLFEYYGKSHGRRELSFETIVGAGVNSTTLHHPISQQTNTLKDGEVVLFDLGYKHNGYSADISRTFPINGKFSEEQRKIYEAVLNTNKAVIEYVKPGLSLFEIQEYAIECLKKEALRLELIKNGDDILKYYIHNVSHYLGLDTHDVGDKQRKLEAGNVITVEPGLYFVEKGIGVRIEDDVLVTETGSRCLSKGIKKEIEDVEKLLKYRL